MISNNVVFVDSDEHVQPLASLETLNDVRSVVYE